MWLRVGNLGIWICAEGTAEATAETFQQADPSSRNTNTGDES